MKKFYRYELYCDGEYQGVGIFHGLTELNLSEELENKLLTLFDDTLKIPPIGMKCEFLFTERGNSIFCKAILSIKHAYEEDGLYEVRLLTVDEKEILPEDTVYEDSNQIAVPYGFLERYRAKMEDQL